MRQMPMVQGMTIPVAVKQQSGSALQICPYCEQTGGGAASGGGVTPPSGGGVTPPSGGGGVTTPHLPWMLPCGTMHVVPGQQSPVMVQLPPDGTQALPPSGTNRQRSCPVSSGTHGTRLQQSL